MSHYVFTGNKSEFARELLPEDNAKDGDLLVPTGLMLTPDSKATTNVYKLFCKKYGYDVFKIKVGYNLSETHLTTMTARDLLDYMFQGNESQLDTTQAKTATYSIWRPKLILTKHSWQTKPLPLP